jgi:hypothetical protein
LNNAVGDQRIVTVDRDWKPETQVEIYTSKQKPSCNLYM